MIRVAIFGASGIVGQTMRLCVPPNVEPRWFAAHDYGGFFEPWDLAWDGDGELYENNKDKWRSCFSKIDVAINLAGENRVDVVERATGDDAYRIKLLNVDVPDAIADWCDEFDAHYVHVSTQGVFSGDDGPYDTDLETEWARPVNTYGCQKREAEERVRAHRNWTIARLTFVVGARPMPWIGRENPLESMLREPVQRQVADRFFSPCFARDAADMLWRCVLYPPLRRIVHIGTPVSTTRFYLSVHVNAIVADSHEIAAINHDDLKGDYPNLAARPLDTTFAHDAMHTRTVAAGISEAVDDYTRRQWLMNGTGRPSESLHQRARELALFFNLTEDDAYARLSRGFAYHHAAVTADFRRAAPVGDAALLDWYRRTDAYCWELSAYHADDGFNYPAMVGALAKHCRERMKFRVLCLGDGIGDLTMACARENLAPIYHDLLGSRTADFAKFRFTFYDRAPAVLLTSDFRPATSGMPLDAVLSLDFMEHVPNVEDWVRAVHAALKPGGLFLAQNAFAQGDDEHGGSIPMHLSANNRFEKDWDPLLDEVGFDWEVDSAGARTGWRKKP